MNSVWINAWVISSLMAGGAVFFARRSGLDWLESVLFSSAFFPAPLLVAISGSNSFIYLFDVVVPVAIYSAWRRWGWVPRRVKTAAVCLLFGAGLVPLLIGAVFANKQDLLFSAINFFRLAGALALMCLLSSTENIRAENAVTLLSAFSWMNVVLLVAMLLQAYNLVNSNVFYRAVPNESSEDHLLWRLIVAGLFRATLGISGTLGLIAYLAQFDAKGLRATFAMIGAASGVTVILLCGSKTSLVAVVMTSIISLILFPRILRHAWLKLSVLCSLVLVAVVAYLPRLDQAYLSTTLGVLGLQEDSFQTLAGRQETWKDGLDLIWADPLSLLAGPSSAVEYLNTAHYHNELVGLLMVGGLWAALPYLVGLWNIGLGLLSGRWCACNIRIFGALAFCCGLLQAIAVNHLTPGILFSGSVALFSIAYGLGLNRQINQSVSPLASPAGEDSVLEEVFPARVPARQPLA